MRAIYTYSELRVFFLCNVCKCMKFRCDRIKGQKRMCLITTKNLRINSVNPELSTTKKFSLSLSACLCVHSNAMKCKEFTSIWTMCGWWSGPSDLAFEFIYHSIELQHYRMVFGSFSIAICFFLCLSFRLNSHQHRGKNTRLLFVW